MRRFLCTVMCLAMLMAGTVAAEERPTRMYDTASGESEEMLSVMTAAPASLSVNAKSAILMDIAGGTVLFEQNSDEPLPIASVTKVMTLLLVMEAIDDGRIALNDTVTVSAGAASMGGSQIWLEENEQMTVEELLKAAVIVSANDACAALAEHLCGTQEAFVERMNTRAAELGAKNTHFMDCSGLDDTGVSSARDIALMSSELLRAHPTIRNYTTVWMDSLRGGASELVNTNRLVRFYNGATGLKTGTTAAAGCCLSATAERDGLALCAVVLGAPSSDDRFGGARQLLDYGFASYSFFTPTEEQLACDPVKVLHGTDTAVAVVPSQTVGFPIDKAIRSSVEVHCELVAEAEAPVEAGQRLGEAVIVSGETELCRIPLVAAASVERLDFGRAFARFFEAMSSGRYR